MDLNITIPELELMANEIVAFVLDPDVDVECLRKAVYCQVRF